MTSRSKRPHSIKLLLAGCLAVLLLAQPSGALAHMDTPVTPDNVWRSWNFDPLVIVPLFLLTALYVSGVRTLWRTAGRGRGVSMRQVLAFTAGIAGLLLALVSPVDQLGGALFSAHMLQHLLLAVIAAPLLVYAAPLTPLLLGLPRSMRRNAGRLSGQQQVRQTSHALLNPFVVWWAQTVGLWIWHVPLFYEAALENSWIHLLEHATFLSTALLFWWLVIQPIGRRRMGLGVVVIFLFTTMLQSGALGALITFAPASWYAAHAPYVEAWGMSLLTDQQLAGLLMWVAGGLVYMGAALAAFLIWLRSMDADAPVPAGPGRVLDSVAGSDRTQSSHSG